ncbi:MAG: polysaccharide biosynthesis C-terminal domain-containing protein, partial [Acetobacteraceae bacterium]|nr:polysaccharide biosynthesis C-terminal domain-containing protein [Acetobacteraceae bacterium]
GLAFGPGWQAAVPVMQILGFPLCLTVFGMVGQTLFLAQGHMGTSLAITVGATLLRLGLLAVLIPPLGLVGAAIAAGAGIAVEQSLSAVWAMRRLGLPLGSLAPLMWRCLVATGCMAAVLAGSGLGWRNLTIPAMAGAILLGAVVYGLTLAALWLAAGRPAGAEADMLVLARRALGRGGA